MPLNNLIPEFEIGEAPTKGVNLDAAKKVDPDNITEVNDEPIQSNIVDSAGTKFNAKLHKDPEALTPKGRFKRLPKALNNADNNENTGEAVKDFIVNYFKDYVADQKEPQVEFSANPIVDKILIDNINTYLDKPNNLLDKADSIHPVIYILGALGIYAAQATHKNKSKTEKIKEYLKEKSARFEGLKAYLKHKFKRGK